MSDSKQNDSKLGELCSQGDAQDALLTGLQRTQEQQAARIAALEANLKNKSSVDNLPEAKHPKTDLAAITKLNMSPPSYTIKATISIGKRTITAEDVSMVAFGANVEINSASLLAMKSTLPKKKFGPAEVKEVSEAKECLSHCLARATMLLRCTSFLEGRCGVRPEVAEFLAALLNNKIALPLPAIDDALLHLAKYCVASEGECFYGGKKMAYAAALEQAGLVVPGLSTLEFKAFTGQSVLVSSAAFAVSVFSSSVLLDVADGVAALTCEAIKAFTAPFAQNVYEVYRPHQGQVLAAGNLRLMLENSMVVNSSGRKTRDPESIRSIPQYHGSARETLDRCVRSARVEVNAAEGGVPSDDKKSEGGFSAEPVANMILDAMRALCTMTYGSARRVRDALSNAEDFKLPAGLVQEEMSGAINQVIVARLEELRQRQVSASLASPDPLLLARLLWEAVEQTRYALAFEAAFSLQAIGISQAEAKKVALEREAKKKAKEAEMAAKFAAQGKKMKAKKEKKKKGASDGIGKGTSSFQQYLQEGEKGFVALTTSEQLIARVEGVEALLDPACPGLGARMSTLLTTTNQVCKPKIPKGTRDSSPEQMAIREKVFSLIKGVFQRHGAVGIDTPVFERREILTGKYGEDSKLIYDLADQGGEMLCLRYDLTVPFARYIASHKISNIKRYHIARVYRRDTPAMNRGRFREFYQCDYDIAGLYAPMVPDAEAIKVLTEILTGLDIGNYKVKLNHRKLLDGLMDVCGVPADKFRAICSAVDKLDKEEWSTVRDEMVNQKGLAPEAADALGSYVTRPPGKPKDFLAELRKDTRLMGHKGSTEAFADLELMFDYMEAMGCLDKVSFDLSLARGLDYYTGVIYEAMLTDSSKVGSIAAGGRYDNLVGMFSGNQVPAVGVSIGIERILAILEDIERERQGGSIRSTRTQVLVASVGKNLLKERMLLCQELWSAGVHAEFLYDLAPKPKKQMDYVIANNIPFVMWIGENEIAEGVVKIKNMEKHDEAIVPRAEVVAKLQALF